MQNKLAVFSMALCVFLLITAEFMPVSLLTPIAQSLHATNGMLGQAVSISGLFAVLSSLLVGPATAKLDRRIVLLSLTVCLGASLALIAIADNFLMLMVGRALLGIVIGAFWALSTSVVMTLVAKDQVPKALGVVYMGNAVAVAFAPPLGSWFGAIIGWRAVFLALIPLAAISFILQAVSLPKLPPRGSASLKQVFSLLTRPNVAWGMGSVMLAFMGAFMMFTYFRPFLEEVTHVTPTQLSFSFLALGVAAFIGTSAASRLASNHLYPLLFWVSIILAGISLAMIPSGMVFVFLIGLLILWGGVNSAIPVAWSSWLARDIADAPEAGGGLMVAVIQLSIMLGASLGGLVLDHYTFTTLFLTGSALLIISGLNVGNGKRIQASTKD